MIDIAMETVIESLEKGHAAYSVSEVARYLHIHPNTLRSWIAPVGGRRPLFYGGIAKTEDDGTWMNFDNFLEVYAIKLLKDGGAKPRDVREAFAQAIEKYGRPFPLLMRDSEVSVGKNGNVLLRLPGDKAPIELTGPRKGQGNFPEIIKAFVNRIHFEGDVATRFTVCSMTYKGALKRVIMEPRINFGEPTVEKTPYRASTLRNAVDVEGSVDNVVRLYGVDKGDVLVALKAFQSAPEFKAAA